MPAWVDTDAGAASGLLRKSGRGYILCLATRQIVLEQSGYTDDTLLPNEMMHLVRTGVPFTNQAADWWYRYDGTSLWATVILRIEPATPENVFAALDMVRERLAGTPVHLAEPGWFPEY